MFCAVAAFGLGAFAVACGNIGLSSGMSPGGGSGDDTSTTHDTDGATAEAAPISGQHADAGTGASPSSSNPLCNVAIQNEAGKPCNPDEPAVPSGEYCQAPDAGALAADASIAADSAVAVPSLACHVILRDNATSQTCSAAGTGTDGASCATGADCAATFECVGMPGRCRHYCCDGDKSCDSGGSSSFCDIQATTESNLKVPVCSPVNKCKLLTPNACPADQTCAVVKDDGTTSCVPIGTALAGQACDTEHCADGLTCLGKPGSRQCYKLCRIGYPEDCSYDTKCKGSSQLFSDPTYGLCQ
jgi:hypothetical protein